MSRTNIVRPFAGDCEENAPEIARLLLAEYAPRLLDFLAEHVEWVSALRLQATAAPGVGWDAWTRLIWALEVTGEIDVTRGEGSEYGWSCIRISTNGWLRAVQRGAVARSGDLVPV